MKQRRKSKRSNADPDEYFAAGPIEFSRFGRLMVGRSRASPEQFAEEQTRMAARLPAMMIEIDSLVTGIAGRVARLPPDRLLHRAWWEFAVVAIGLDGKEVHDMEQATVMLMVECLQSIIASVAPNECYREELRDEEWGMLSMDGSVAVKAAPSIQPSARPVSARSLAVPREYNEAKEPPCRNRSAS